MLSHNFKSMTFSKGTLKTEDLLNQFVDFAELLQSGTDIKSLANSQKRRLSDLKKEAFRLSKLMEYAEELDYYEEYLNWKEKGSLLFNEDIFDFLNEIAPVGWYFGTQKGDGSHFGFWQVSDREFGETVKVLTA